jgi:hypothetical protein
VSNLISIDGMTPTEKCCFELLDKYSRSEHACFLAEMFLSADASGYQLCFRPVDGTRSSSNRYACLYLEIGTEEARASASCKLLTDDIVEWLDSELPALSQM